MRTGDSFASEAAQTVPSQSKTARIMNWLEDANKTSGDELSAVSVSDEESKEESPMNRKRFVERNDDARYTCSDNNKRASHVPNERENSVDYNKVRISLMTERVTIINSVFIMQNVSFLT